MNGLDLFSGIGGISLALEPWVRTVAYCEQDRYAQGVLLSRMQSGDIDRAPIWDDVRTLRKEHLPEIDIVLGGFPCQDISSAGLGRGLMAGERSGLYFEIERLVCEIRPRFVFLENVPAIRTRGLNTVIQSLTEFGYDCRWTVVSAAEVGAPHLRKRWFLLAHAKSARGRDELSQELARETNDITFTNGARQSLANTASSISERWPIETRKQSGPADASWWSTEPDVGRVAYGISNRVDRIKCLGNAVVPAQAREAFKRLLGIE